MPVLLVGYLLARSEDRPRAACGRAAPPSTASTSLRGLVVAAVVGGTGLAFYLVTHALGVDLTVVAEDLPSIWWRYPVLLLSALQNALLEEFVVLGYLMMRLRQLGVRPAAAAIGTSALVRGSYHLYQGLGGFVGNAVMGVLFGWLYTALGPGERRWWSRTPCSTCSRSSATPCSPARSPGCPG